MDTRFRIAAGSEQSDGLRQSEGSRGPQAGRRERACSGDALHVPQGQLGEQREDAEQECDGWSAALGADATGPRERPHPTGWLRRDMH
jgi:hypothetical protein